MPRRTCGVGIVLVLASGTLAGAPPSSVVEGRTSIHVAIDDRAQVPKVTEFTFDFGEPQHCQISYGYWFRISEDRINEVSVFETADGADWSYTRDTHTHVKAADLSVNVWTGEDPLFGVSITRSSGTYSGRATLTLLIPRAGTPSSPKVLPSNLALDVTCEEQVTVTARAGQELQLLPDSNAPLSMHMEGASGQVGNDWEMFVAGNEGHLMADGFGDQNGRLGLSTPKEAVTILLPQIDFTHMIGARGSYLVEISRMATNGEVWVAAYDINRPLDLTPLLRNRATIGAPES